VVTSTFGVGDDYNEALLGQPGGCRRRRLPRHRQGRADWANPGVCLDAEAEQHREILSSRDTKAIYYAAASQAKGRSATGERKRRSALSDPD